MNKGWYWDDVTRQLYRWNDLVKLLTKVLDDLSFLTSALQNQLGVPVGTPV